MNHTNLKIICLFTLLVGCIQFQPIAIYDVTSDEEKVEKQRIFFNDTQGELWTNLGSCGSFKIVEHEKNNVILLDWNKVGCDWVGIGNSWSAFMADDISELIENHAISFRVKAVESPQKSIPFVIGLEDYSGGSSYVFSHLNLYANDLLVSNQKWTTFYMPLSEYDFTMQGVDLYGIKQMIIQLEGSGKIYLDDVKLVPFTKDQYVQMRKDVELLKPKGNPNQPIFPGDFEEMAWGTGNTNCQSLSSTNSVINWQWNNCNEWKKWGINWNNWYAFNLRGIVDKTSLFIQVSKNHDHFEIAIEDFQYKRTKLSTKNLQFQSVNDTIISYEIPLDQFELEQQKFKLDEMKQIEFFGLDQGQASIYEIKLFER